MDIDSCDFVIENPGIHLPPLRPKKCGRTATQWVKVFDEIRCWCHQHAITKPGWEDIITRDEAVVHSVIKS